ncbi:hypothetical protein JR065_02925 [Xanthomonas sp. AmX2]|uniref:hypothetical protein n=1 Tax=Xanthomonas sp. TaxID=29446 RepID=UPI00197F8C87|nr:hypothetical protein [Xanthomonas sp.]MBN6149280.1 hypothetical protein [Xanthomonas sp.]
MPNGKPGDHPLSDLRYGRGTGYGEEFDTLALALLERPGSHHAEVERIVSYMPSVYVATQEDIASALAQALPRLRALLQQCDGAGPENTHDA